MWYKINVEQSSCNNHFDLLFSMEFSFLYNFDLLAKSELICLHGLLETERLMNFDIHVVPVAMVHLMVK